MGLHVVTHRFLCRQLDIFQRNPRLFAHLTENSIHLIQPCWCVKFLHGEIEAIENAVLAYDAANVPQSALHPARISDRRR